MATLAHWSRLAKPAFRQFRSSGMTPSTISRPAYRHERKSLWSKPLPESPQVTFVSPQGLANLALEPTAFNDRALIEPWIYCGSAQR